jgi:hypothetical protein
VSESECVVLLSRRTPCACSRRLTAFDMAEVEVFERRAASEKEPTSTIRTNQSNCTSDDGNGGIDTGSTLP